MLKIAHEDEVPWGHGARHRSSSINYRPMISGEEGAVDNYKLNIGRIGPEFFSPRHRHNFDQVRYCLEGKVSIGPKIALTPGQLGYFPEGTAYGPQTQSDGATNMVIQCGGASGQGIMTPRQVSTGYETLVQHGRFDGGIFHRNEDSNIVRRAKLDAYEAIWEFTNGRPLEYPKPRYDEPVIMRPENFDWQPHPGVPGAATKSLGIFGERSFELSMLRVAAADVPIASRAGRRLVFVLEGEGLLGDQPVRSHSCIEIPAETPVSLSTSKTIAVLMAGLPIFKTAGPAR